MNKINSLFKATSLFNTEQNKIPYKFFSTYNYYI